MKDSRNSHQDVTLKKKRRRATTDAVPYLSGSKVKSRLERTMQIKDPIPPLPFGSQSNQEVTTKLSTSQQDCRSSYPAAAPPKGCHGFRKDYKLGDSARSVSHMKIVESHHQSFIEASKIKTYDFAFIRRNDGSWTYAICATQFKEAGEDCMLFVLNETGATKVLKRRFWADFIRPVAAQVDDVKIPEYIYVGDCADDDSLFSYGSC